jgi:hypothetical protein
MKSKNNKIKSDSAAKGQGLIDRIQPGFVTATSPNN